MRKFGRRTFGRTMGGMALTVAGGVGWSAPARAQDPFILGAILPVSGLYAPLGDFIAVGLRLGVATVNAEGGILGRKVELVIQDDAGNPGRALLAARELVSEKRAAAIYPGIISGTALATLPFLTSQKVITISNGSSTSIGDAQQFPYSFQLSDTSAVRVPPVAAAVKRLGGTKVGIIVSTNPANAALGDQLMVELKPKYGLEPVGIIKVVADIKDLTPMVQNMRDRGADILVFDGIGRPGITMMMTALQTLNWNAKMITEPAVLSGDLAELMPEEMRAQFYSVNYRTATRTAGGNPKVREFTAELEKLGLKSTNLGWSLLARDSVLLQKWAFETAHGKSGKTDPDSVKAALETLETTELPTDYLAMIGNPKYSPTRHTTEGADFSDFWSLIGPSRLVDGTYEGEVLELLK